MTVTANTLIQETQRLLGPTQREKTIEVGAAGYVAGATTFTFTDNSASQVNTLSIIPGTVISCDLELFLIQSIPVGGTVLVTPGYLGSTTANHTAGTVSYISRRFTDFECLVQINHVLDELGGEGLYNLGTIEFVYNAVQQAYDMTDINNGPMTGYIEGVSVRCKTPLPDRKYRTVPANHWELLTNMSDDANFPSGFALALNDWEGPWPGQYILFNYKQSFVNMTAYTDNAQTKALLAPTMNDIPPMGAMLRMVAPREVARNQTQVQPDSRLAPEVPPGAVSGSVNGVRAQYEMRINDEKSRLKRAIGQMRRRY